MLIVLLLVVAVIIAVLSGLNPPKAKLWWAVVAIAIAVFLCCGMSLLKGATGG
jgi:VIT1/CCC1 family predicted Fe2+/Mn2+ transporter